MKLKARQNGEHPKGLYWLAGEVREVHLDLDPDQLPAWLEVVPPEKATRGKPKEK